MLRVDWLAPWQDYEIEPSDSCIDAGDAVVLVFRQAGTGPGSDVRIERDFFAVYDLKDSKDVRFRLFESREQALEASPGCREWTLRTKSATRPCASKASVEQVSRR